MGRKAWMGSDGKESLQPADDKGKREEDGRVFPLSQEAGKGEE